MSEEGRHRPLEAHRFLILLAISDLAALFGLGESPSCQDFPTVTPESAMPG